MPLFFNGEHDSSMTNTNMDSFNSIWSYENFPFNDVLSTNTLDEEHVF
jgi:hypothetical protein